jgi:hypothetical protein
MKAGKVSTCPVCHVGFVQSQWPRVYCTGDCAQKASKRLEEVYTMTGRDLTLAMDEVRAE